MPYLKLWISLWKSPFLRGFVLISAALFAGGLIMAARMPALAKRSVAVTLLVIGLMYMGCFEWTREAGRRPYLIHSYMYSNGALAGSEKTDISIDFQGRLLGRISRSLEPDLSHDVLMQGDLLTINIGHLHVQVPGHRGSDVKIGSRIEGQGLAGGNDNLV